MRGLKRNKNDCLGGGGGFVFYDPPSHCKPLSCLIPNARDRSESSILELGAKKEEDIAFGTSQEPSRVDNSVERPRKRFKMANLKIPKKRKELDDDANERVKTLSLLQVLGRLEEPWGAGDSEGGGWWLTLLRVLLCLN